MNNLRKIREPICRIVVGQEYLYACDWPPGCKDCRYRVEEFSMFVPSYQQVVIVRAMEGPDAGNAYVCSPGNFSTHYKTIPVEETAGPGSDVEVPELVIDYRSKGHGA